MIKIPVRHINSAIKEPSPSGKFIARTLSELLSGNAMIQEIHRHSFYFILVLKKGSGKHTIDFVTYPVTDNSIFIMRPGQVHELTLNKGCEGFLLQFPADYFFDTDNYAKQILKKVAQRNYYTSNVESLIKIFTVIDTIIREELEKKMEYEYVIKTNLQLFFIELLRQESNLSESSKSQSANSDILEAFQDLVTNSVSSHKQVNWYASQLHLTTHQLNSITKTTLGKTCLEIINDHILLEAKRYLLGTDNQINQISWHLGYEDVSYFIRFFKKHLGYSPEAFRNNFNKSYNI
jgi:AraC family transcriptional activator of pobA